MEKPTTVIEAFATRLVVCSMGMGTDKSAGAADRHQPAPQAEVGPLLQNVVSGVSSL
jgi:hypothetical protein